MLMVMDNFQHFIDLAYLQFFDICVAIQTEKSAHLNKTTKQRPP